MKKKCKKCTKEKEVNEKNFYKHPTGKDGFRTICKDCNSLDDYGKPHQGTITQFNNTKRKSIEYDNGTKLCIDCKEVKPIENNFGKDKTLLLPRCKECDSFKRIFDKYGLTKEQYLNLLENQNYKCKICKNTELYYDKLIVDHDHNTGKVRGLLCSGCNKGLGLFKDNPEFLVRAADYIRSTK